MEVIHESPKTSSFVPLAEHQSTTPASFYSGPPILHYHSSRSKIVILASDIGNSAPFSSLARAYDNATKDSATTNGHSTADTNGEGSAMEKPDPVIADAEVWVTSEKLLLYSAIASTGLSIPYPTISLHAIQSLPEDEGQQGLYMQHVSSLGGDETGAEEDEDMETISVTIIPAPPTSTEQPATSDLDAEPPNETQSQSEATKLFNALSTCSNLHPDPVSEDDPSGAIEGSSLFQAGLISAGDSAGGLPPPMPGSGGWITTENVGDYVDEDGNWIEGDEEEHGGTAPEESEPLGPGAGTVRTRGEEPETESGGMEDGSGETDETKWRRTE